MEYPLLVGVILFIGCCVAALILEPPTRIGQGSPADRQGGSRARRADMARRSRYGRAAVISPLPSPASFAAPVSSSPEDLSPTVSAQHEAVPLEDRGVSAKDDALPYSPQELRNLLERRPHASSHAS
jgi:hypothetical protein